MSRKTIQKIASIALVALVTLIAGSRVLINTSAHADDSLGTKLQNDAADAKKDVKKSGRKFKKTVRNKTGHGSVKKDIGDKVDDVKDNVSTEAGKIKRSN